MYNPETLTTLSSQDTGRIYDCSLMLNEHFLAISWQ